MAFSGTGTGIQNADDVLFNNVAQNETVQYDTTSAKWKNSHLETGFLNVKDYGAAGDGTTDDSAALLAAVTAADAAGGGTVYFPGNSSYMLASPLTVSGVTDITLAGASRESTTLLCAAGFVAASGSSDRWTIRDLNIQCTTSVNTYDGVVVDYPRRWIIEKCRFEGFGGDSIRYEGGLHSRVAWNYIKARDPSQTNGHAGIHIRDTLASLHGTTITTERNYVGTAKSYGILWENVGNSTSIGDIIEFVNPGVGLRTHESGVTIIDLYTEQITGNEFEIHDSSCSVIGALRNEPIVTWQNVAFANRNITRVTQRSINTGGALVVGGGTGQIDATLAPSIRSGPGSPEGAQTAVVGSIWMRTDGSAGSTLYCKQSGTGNAGWTALGA